MYDDFKFYWENPAYDKNHVLILKKQNIRPKDTEVEEAKIETQKADTSIDPNILKIVNNSATQDKT